MGEVSFLEKVEVGGGKLTRLREHVYREAIVSSLLFRILLTAWRNTENDARCHLRFEANHPLREILGRLKRGVSNCNPKHKRRGIQSYRIVFRQTSPNYYSPQR